MNKSKSILGKIENVVIETDDYIFPIRIDSVLYAEINNQHCIQVYSAKTGYEVTDKQNNLIKKLDNAGFIRIQNMIYVNPKHISEFKIKEQYIELVSGQKLAIQSTFINQLIRYFILV